MTPLDWPRPWHAHSGEPFEGPTLACGAFCTAPLDEWPAELAGPPLTCTGRVCWAVDRGPCCCGASRDAHPIGDCLEWHPHTPEHWRRP